MVALTVTITDTTFDKKSAEVEFLEGVLHAVAADLRKKQGAQTGAQTVLGTNPAGTANSTIATYTYTASGSTP